MKVRYGEINEWTEKKLEYIGKYLNAYTSVFKFQSWVKGVIYIDLFAGPGICYSKLHKKEVDGSPAISIKVDPPFSEYIFCDIEKENTDRITELTKSKQNIHIEHGDANVYVNNLVTHLDPNKPTFVFLDPQALDLHYKTIEILAKNLNRVDFLITFPIGEIFFRETSTKECYSCKNNAKNCEHCIEPVFFDDAWKKVAYTYFKESNMKPKVFLQQILKLYMEPLEKLDFKWAVKHMKNKNNSQIYDLIFATRNVLPAMKIMRDVMCDDDQLSLLSITDELSKMIVTKYKQHKDRLTVKTILNDMFTGDNNYRERDFQKALGQLETEGKLSRSKPVSKRKKRFDPDESFVLIYNKNSETHDKTLSA